MASSTNLFRSADGFTASGLDAGPVELDPPKVNGDDVEAAADGLNMNPPLLGPAGDPFEGV